MTSDLSPDVVWSAGRQGCHSPSTDPSSNTTRAFSPHPLLRTPCETHRLIVSVFLFNRLSSAALRRGWLSRCLFAAAMAVRIMVRCFGQSRQQPAQADSLSHPRHDRAVSCEGTLKEIKISSRAYTEPEVTDWLADLWRAFSLRKG